MSRLDPRHEVEAKILHRKLMDQQNSYLPENLVMTTTDRLAPAESRVEPSRAPEGGQKTGQAGSTTERESDEVDLIDSYSGIGEADAEDPEKEVQSVKIVTSRSRGRIVPEEDEENVLGEEHRQAQRGELRQYSEVDGQNLEDRRRDEHRDRQEQEQMRFRQQVERYHQDRYQHHEDRGDQHRGNDGRSVHMRHLQDRTRHSYVKHREQSTKPDAGEPDTNQDDGVFEFDEPVDIGSAAADIGPSTLQGIDGRVDVPPTPMGDIQGTAGGSIETEGRTRGGYRKDNRPIGGLDIDVETDYVDEDESTEGTLSPWDIESESDRDFDYFTEDGGETPPQTPFVAKALEDLPFAPRRGLTTVSPATLVFWG